MITSLEHRFIELFLKAVYNIHDDEVAADIIFGEIDYLLESHSYELIDKILQRLDLEELNSSLMRSFLCITNAAKGKLPSRSAFFQRVEEWMLPIGGAERTEKIIGRLR